MLDKGDCDVDLLAFNQGFVAQEKDFRHNLRIWEFPQVRGTILGVSIVRITVH